MKFAKILLMALLVFPFLSCSKKEKDRLLVGEIPGTSGATAMGTITLGTGGSSFASPAVTSFATNFPSTEAVPKANITIVSIEVTQNGTNWVTVSSSPLQITLTTDFQPDFRPILDPINIPAGEYHGVRVTISPNTTFENVSESGNFGEYPLFYLAYKRALEISDHVELTSATGALVPFTVTGNENTYLSFGLKFGWGGNDPSVWHLVIGINATSIAP